MLCECVDFLSKCQQAMQDYKAAAYALSSYKWDDVVKKSSGGGSSSSPDWMSVERRVEWYVRTAQFWLEENETGSASQQIKRAHALIQELPKPPPSTPPPHLPRPPASPSSSFLQDVLRARPRQ